MRRLAPILGFLLLASLAGAQATYWRWDGNLQNPAGQAIGGAKVYIYSQATGGLATLYANNAGTALPVNCGALSGIGNRINNPITSNGYGEACAYLATGCYTIQYVSPTTGTKTYADQGPGCLGSGTFLPLSGGALSGALSGTTGNFTGGVTAPVTGHASLDLPLTGGTLSGNLTLPSTIAGGPTIDVRYNGALCNGSDDTAAYQTSANTANALYVATGQKVGVRTPGTCTVSGIVTALSGVNFVGPGTIAVPDQTHIGVTAVHHPTILFNNADTVGVDGLTINVTTPCPGNDATCAAIQWLPAGADSVAHKHVSIRNTTIVNADWGILVGYYGTGTGSLSDVDISNNDIESPAGAYTNADGIHVAGRVSGIRINSNFVGYRNDAGIALTSEGSGTYTISGATITGNVLRENRVGIDCSGCTDTDITGNNVKATIASAGNSNPAFRQIYYNGYPSNVRTSGNYFENPASVDASTVKIDPILAGQVSWPNLNSTFKNNVLGGSNGVLYARGNGLSIAGNTFLISGGGIILDYDGADSVATANVTIGTNQWQSAGVVTFGAGCALYSNIGYFPQQALGSLTVSNLSCIGTQSVNFPGTITLGSNAMSATAGSYLTFTSGTGSPSFGANFQDAAGHNLLTINPDGSGINVPDGPINTSFYYKMGGGSNGGLRNASGTTVVPGTATDYMGASATIVGMCEAKSMTTGNFLKVGASGGCADSGVSAASLAGGVVNSINGTVGAYTFTGGGVSCTTTTCTFTAGTPTLPNATDTFNGLKVNGAGAGTIVTTAQGGTWEGVINGGADNAGSVDAGAILNAQTTAACSGSTPVRIHLAAGTYKVNSGWTIAATSTTCKNMVIEGDGSANTIIQSNCSGGVNYVIGWINSTSPAAEHFNGPTFRHLTIKNNGGSACAVGLLLSQTAVFKVEDLVITGFAGQTYATGTISSTADTITGTGTTFTAAMVHGFIETTSGNTTTRAEICAFGSATSLTLCSTAFPSGNIAGGTSYGLVYGGDGLACDPGAGISGSPFTQYGTIKDVYAVGDLIGIHAWGTTSASSAGCSRIQVTGNAGYVSPSPGGRVTDSVGIWLGKHSDTWEISAPINNSAACIVNDSGHANWIIGAKCENGGSYAPVTTCNGGVGLQACTAAWEVSSDAGANGWNTTIEAAYAYKVGNVYQFDNSGGAFNSSITAPRDLSGGYTQHYYFYGTTTCPGNGSGIPIMITAYDCNHQLVAQTVN